MKFNPSKLFHLWFWKDLRYQVRDFFFPRQRWLTKQIPRSWRDKDFLIETCLFAILVDYVENEDETILKPYDLSDDLAAGHVSQEYIDYEVEWKNRVKEVYNYIKFHRPRFHKELNAAYPETPPIEDWFKPHPTKEGYNIMKSCEETHSKSYEEL